MSANKIQEPKVITIPELLVVLLLSLSLMVLFFPKNSIQQAIESEKSNYDLTLIYLKSIARAYPDNPQNWLRLMDAQLKMGHLHEAQKTFQRMQRFDTIDHSRLSVMGYQLIKTRYQKSSDALQKKQLLALIKKKLHRFIQSNDPTLWLTAIQEARSLHLPKIRFKALQKRLSHATLIDITEVRELYTLGVQLGYEKESIALLEALLQKSADMQIAQLLKSYYLAKNDYAATGRLCEMLYQKFDRKNCFFEAVKYAFFAKEGQKALQLLKAHQLRFLNDPKAAEKIIRLYLANGYVKEAHAYSLQVMQKQGVLP